MITWLYRRMVELLTSPEDVTVFKQNLKNLQEKNTQFFARCYAYTLNLVLGDTASACLDVANYKRTSQYFM